MKQLIKLFSFLFVLASCGQQMNESSSLSADSSVAVISSESSVQEKDTSSSSLDDGDGSDDFVSSTSVEPYPSVSYADLPIPEVGENECLITMIQVKGSTFSTTDNGQIDYCFPLTYEVYEGLPYQYVVCEKGAEVSDDYLFDHIVLWKEVTRGGYVRFSVFTSIDPKVYFYNGVIENDVTLYFYIFG